MGRVLGAAPEDGATSCLASLLGKAGAETRTGASHQARVGVGGRLPGGTLGPSWGCAGRLRTGIGIREWILCPPPPPCPDQSRWGPLLAEKPLGESGKDRPAAMAS